MPSRAEHLDHIEIASSVAVGRLEALIEVISAA
jgi:hypothetical protein